MDLIRDWFQRHFSDPQVAILAALLLIGFAAVVLLGQMLAPVIAALVIAYLLEPPVRLLERLRWPRWAAVSAVFLAFMAGFLFLMLGLVPVLWQQSLLLLQQMPYMISAVQDLLLRLPQKYPDFVTEQQVTDLMAGLRNEIAVRGQSLLTYSVASMLGLMYFGVYLIVVPMGVFFLLKDKKRILDWIADFLPRETSLAARVWREVNQQIANYVRGKVYEILIVGAVTYVVFALLGLQFALLLAALSGLAVVIPYIGAVAVTVPVALIAYFQWGWGGDFAFAVAAYVVIHMLDGNALATLLASEVVNLHPIAVIVAILVFGGMFGFWGVFFAIPLATLVHAVLRAWPRIPREPRALKE
ncbi:MAG: AI-2E family transporter [Geminicoccaceae bacterium]